MNKKEKQLYKSPTMTVYEIGRTQNYYLRYFGVSVRPVRLVAVNWTSARAQGDRMLSMIVGWLEAFRAVDRGNEYG